MDRTLHIPNCDGAFEICWDNLGIPHVYAGTVADAFRGMGYVEGYERLWQIHLSCLYANGEAASVFGERFVAQDVFHRAFDVPAHRIGMPDSHGDWIVDAYLDGLNAYVGSLTEPPPEFAGIDATPRPFTRADVASRYRFSSWFQARSWPDKMYLGRMLARHGVDRFRRQLPAFSDGDAEALDALAEPLRDLDLAPISLIAPTFKASGSNNWAVTGKRTASGMPLLATDPHQPHGIPNTFFYVHLHAPNWDVFGASFPGVPYFMMGYTRDVAWGLTTGFVDNYDVYVEEVDGDRVRTPMGWEPLQRRVETVHVRGQDVREFEVLATRHGPLLEPLTHQLGLRDAPPPAKGMRTSLRWALGHCPTSAGTLARLPLSTSAGEFGDMLFEDDVTPLVNNIIAVDRHDSLRRYIAAILPKRQGVTGVLPLPGWDARYDFEQSTMAELTVEVDPPSGFAVTANNDTLGDRAPYPIHTFAANSARADRVTELIGQGDGFTAADFEAMQADLKDLRATRLIPELLPHLADTRDRRLVEARLLLESWDCRADTDSAAAALYYAFTDRLWHRRYLVRSLGDEFRSQPVAAPMLSRAEPSAYPPPLWDQDLLAETIREVFVEAHEHLTGLFGPVDQWRYGAVHQVHFWHTLRKRTLWEHMTVGPEPHGGSPTTLAMAMHMAYGLGEASAAGTRATQRVYHGPAFRLVVDMADTDHCRFVIASGNSGRPDGRHVTDHFATWLTGDHYTVSLRREELNIEETWRVV